MNGSVSRGASAGPRPALRAWVWRNRPPRWRRRPWTEPQLRRLRTQWNVGVAAGWSDRKIARAAAPTLAPHSVGSVYMQAYRLGLHGQPRPPDLAQYDALLAGGRVE